MVNILACKELGWGHVELDLQDHAILGPTLLAWDQGVEVVELLDLLIVVDLAVVLFLEAPESGLVAPKSA